VRLHGLDDLCHTYDRLEPSQLTERNRVRLHELWHRGLLARLPHLIEVPHELLAITRGDGVTEIHPERPARDAR
jgi:hypothetical protein